MEGVLVTQMSSNARISVWWIVWVMKNRSFVSKMFSYPQKNMKTMSHCTTQFNLWPSKHLRIPRIAQHFKIYFTNQTRTTIKYAGWSLELLKQDLQILFP